MVNILIGIAIYLIVGFIYAVILRSQNVVYKKECFAVVLMWPVHLIVRFVAFILDIFDWISIEATVDFFAKRLPFSKLKD